MDRNAIKEPPPNRVIKLYNITCPYCGENLKKSSREEEHVIGKRFVPKGTLHGQWNLILQSCQCCNTKKSDLEDDISAITLASLAWFDDSDISESVLNEVKRKSKGSLSRKTNKYVAKSSEEMKLEFSLSGGANIKFNTIAPPQIDDSRSFKLALMQIAGFFYFISYDEKSKKGGFIPEGFYPIEAKHYKDWGNKVFKTFMKSVANWNHRWYGTTAKGFFKSIIRKHPSKQCWSWALEWNKSYRLIGFFGSQEIAQNIIESFPPLKMKISKGKNSTIRYREEVKLDEKDDILFNLNYKT